MTKKDLIDQLKTFHLNFEFGLACLSLINDPIALNALPQLSVNFGSYKHKHDRITSILSDKNGKQSLINNFFKRSLMCTTIKDYYDSISYYCDKSQSNQYSSFKNEPYYQFIRVIRNTMSHGYKFDFSKMNKGIFPVSWNGKTINLSDEHKEITEDKLNFHDVFMLLNKLENFVGNKIH